MNKCNNIKKELWIFYLEWNFNKYIYKNLIKIRWCFIWKVDKNAWRCTCVADTLTCSQEIQPLVSSMQAWTNSRVIRVITLIWGESPRLQDDGPEWVRVMLLGEGRQTKNVGWLHFYKKAPNGEKNSRKPVAP